MLLVSFWSILFELLEEREGEVGGRKGVGVEVEHGDRGTTRQPPCGLTTGQRAALCK